MLAYAFIHLDMSINCQGRNYYIEELLRSRMDFLTWMNANYCEKPKKYYNQRLQDNFIYLSRFSFCTLSLSVFRITYLYVNYTKDRKISCDNFECFVIYFGYVNKYQTRECTYIPSFDIRLVAVKCTFISYYQPYWRQPF